MSALSVIGITGGIGSGKSVVSRILRCRGYEVYDCDYEARRIMEASVQLKTELAARLGADCIALDGSLRRDRIAEYVFADKDALLWLNRQVHAMVREDIKKRIEAAGDFLFVESAIMHTAALDEMCSEIWVVTVPQEVCLQRACLRDGVEPHRVRARMNAQALEIENIACAAIKVIHNDSHDSLLSQIDNLLKN